jgi:hypothetical protein
MTAKIKLNSASGGGSFSLQAPSSSSNNRVITLPDITDGTLLTNQSSGLGKILQVVGNTQTYSSSTTTTSTSYTNLTTTLNTSITPSASSSKIFVIMSAPIYAANSYNGGIASYTIGRNGSVINNASYGDIYQNANGVAYHNLTMSILDTPSTDQQVTYNFMCKTSNSSNAIGISSYGSNEVVNVTLFEVGA